jgi:hypothetical protein
METLEHRIRRYLLAKLRRHAVLDLYERAASVGLLECRHPRGLEAVGKRWIVSEKAKLLLCGAQERDGLTVKRMMQTGRGRVMWGDDATQSHSDDGSSVTNLYDWSPPAPKSPAKPRASKTRGGIVTVGSSISFGYLSRLLKEHLPAPSPLHVALVLLIARAVGTSSADMVPLTEALRSDAGFVLIKAPIARFEMGIGLMLEDGLLLPFGAKLEDATREGPLSGRYSASQSTPPHRRVIKTMSGAAVARLDEPTIRRRLRRAMMEEPAPILLVDETVDALTPVVTATADLVLECGGFDRAMLADLIHLCLGLRVEESIAQLETLDFDPERLSIDDIVLSIRPGRSVEEMITIMAMLIERFSGGEDGGNRTRGGDQNRAGSGGRSGTPKSAEAGIQIIEPAAAPAEAVDRPAQAVVAASRVSVATVQSLTGYGLARDWALDLKADLALWREGRLDWSEMSTRLLLSGPPGTGKTTFARALCNTLEVPLLATSVAHWLEPSYLGDVLKRMCAAFDLAAAKAPAILFIDEIDNIGSRQAANGRSYDDYWVTLINRLLQLLDGAARTEGVVVVAATNLPDKIDPALTRSGRLETHMRLSLPDLDALTGILAHHLGDDLPAVISSAPATRPHRLKPRPSQNHVPGRLRRVSENRKTDKNKERKL